MLVQLKHDRVSKQTTWDLRNGRRSRYPLFRGLTGNVINKDDEYLKSYTIQAPKYLCVDV